MQKMFPVLVCTTLISAALVQPAAATEAEVRAGLAADAMLAYGQILADGVRAGRLYSREATASGARRHAEEFLARQFVPAVRTTAAQ